ncbi:MAG: hypothetical protein LBK08_08310 [Treponema sp.]|nr:hypothetical protein [Treponema sp.]
MKKAARTAVYVKKIPEFVSQFVVVGTVFALSLSLSLSLSLNSTISSHSLF